MQEILFEKEQQQKRFWTELHTDWLDQGKPDSALTISAIKEESLKSTLK